MALIFLSFFLVLFSFYTINLPTADIGRHIVNGEMFLHSAEYGVFKGDILYKNFFSYTYPDFPFINHHWGSGVIIYLIYSVLGFGGLSLIYFLLIWGAFIFALAVVRDETDLNSILLTGIFLIPLIAGRIEVRPEGLSYFFLALFLYILYRYSKSPKEKQASYGAGKMSAVWLWMLPILELIWANTHIYFIFGPFLIGIFLIEALLLRNIEKAKRLAIILGASLVAMCATPYGTKGALYPFTIFQNYGYRIVENQSINFLEHLSFINPEFLWYKIILLLVLVSSIIIITKQRRSFALGLSLISFTFALLGYLGIRHIPAFALVSLPLLAYNITVIKKIFSTGVGHPRFRCPTPVQIDEDLKIILYAISFCILIGITMFHFSTRLPWNRNFGLGINEGALAPIEFIKNNGIHGPFFNNYDIGAFMIFGLFPKEKIFVDNRPEAYPKEFFENIYIPMQENEEIWKKEMLKNKFNAIFFDRLDYTPWAQKFLISRVRDPLWAPVYIDNQTIILLDRNQENEKIIKQYEIPKSVFGIKK